MSERTQRMVRMYVEEGLSYAEIGEHFGVTRQRVHQLIGDKVEARPAADPALRIQAIQEAHGRVMRNETTLDEEAERLGYRSGDSLRSSMAKRGLLFAGREQPSRRVLAPHGTYERYRQQCRCEECRAANAQRNRELRGTGNPPNHGTASGYRNYGCKCTPCKEAYALALRDYRARSRRKKRPRGTAARERRITS